MKIFLVLRRTFEFSITEKELVLLCERVLKPCPICQAVKKKTGPKQNTMDYVPIPEDVFDCVCMDFLQLPVCKDKEGRQFDYILVIVCRLSGFILGLPCRKEGLTAEKVADMFLKNVAIFGLPHEIMSDCDHLINSKFMRTVCALAGITQHTSIIYRPRGNGRAEAAVRLVVETLRRTLAENPSDWIYALPWALWQLNNLPGVLDDYSPHQIVFGRESIGLGDVPPFKPSKISASAEDFIERVYRLKDEVQKKLTHLHEQKREQFLKHHRVVTYEPGDRVWVRNLPHEGQKLDPLWTGPCEVLTRVGQTGRYKIAMPEGVQDVHIDRLKLYLPSIVGEKITMHYFRPQRDIPEDDALVVEKIVGHRTKAGKHQWKVRWKGYDQQHDTWEPASSFVGYIQTDWIEYNKVNHIEVPVTALGMEADD